MKRFLRKTLIKFLYISTLVGIFSLRLVTPTYGCLVGNDLNDYNFRYNLYSEESIKNVNLELTDEFYEYYNRFYLGKFYITCYCSCSKCCGKWAGGPTASGVYPVEGITIAADTSVLPFGTKVAINGHTYTVQDTGSAIKGNRIDVYMSSHEACFNYEFNGWRDIYLVEED